MSDHHLSVDVMARLARGETTSADLRSLLRHLANHCPQCAEALALFTASQGGLSAPRETAPADPLSSALALLRDREGRGHQLAESLMAELMDLDEASARERIRTDQRFHVAVLVPRLRETSQRAIFATQMSQALHAARCAVAVAEALPEAVYRPGPVADLQAEALGALGNALRCAGQLTQSEDALNRAAVRLAGGVGDPMEGARLSSYRASLATDQGDYEVARSLLEDCLEVHEALEDDEARVRTLVHLGAVASLEHPEEGRGIPYLEEAVRLLDPETQPRLYLSARHNLASALADAGQAQAARLLVEASRHLYDAADSDWSSTRRQWLEGRIAIRLGEWFEAESKLTAVWSRYLTLGLQLEPSLVALDLASCYLAQGKSARAAQLAGQVAELFDQWNLHHRLQDAWRTLEGALVQGTATTVLLRRLEGYLSRAWKNPVTRFQASR